MSFVWSNFQNQQLDDEEVEFKIMQMHQSPTNITNQTASLLGATVSPRIAPIDPKLIVEHGESPTAIILAIAILIAILLGSLTGLVRVVVILIVRQTKPKR